MAVLAVDVTGIISKEAVCTHPAVANLFDNVAGRLVVDFPSDPSA